MKLLSWNIRQGGGTRVTGICDAVAEFAPDLLVLSEFRVGMRGEAIRSELKRQGFATMIHGDAQGNENGVLAAARAGGLETTRFPGADPKYAHCVVRLATPDFDLFGVYLPHKKRHGLFDFLYRELRDARPAIVAGDFNSGVNFIDQKGKSFWYTHELQALGRIGYVDAFRELHPDAREYSWFSHGGNGYRYDHTWLHADLAPGVRTCSYLHAYREAGLSDHSPMLLEWDAET